MAKEKTTEKKILIIMIALLLSISFLGCGLNFNSKSTETSKSYGGTGTLKVTVLNVGQGLSVLIECEDEYALYDGGNYDFLIERSDSGYGAASLLKENGVDELKYIFASHYDSDHVGGLSDIIDKYVCHNFICPDYECDTKTYQNLFQTVSDNKIPITHPAVGDTFSLGSANISILGPINNSYDEENNYSLIIRITHDTTSYIITGDATYLSENEVVKKYGNELNSDVYIVGHHGSVSSSSIKFLKAVSPEYSIISVGSENEYGHPHKEVISRLQAINSEIYRTDISGTITMESSEDKGFSIHAALEE